MAAIGADREDSGSTRFGGACRDLYAEQVLVPRLALASLLAVVVLTVVLVRQRRSRRMVEVMKPVPELDIAAETGIAQGNKRLWAFLAATFVWVAFVFWRFQASKTPVPMSTTASDRPRIVFSFTTTPEGITQMKPTLDALMSQEGVGFDTVYVIIPRVYRNNTVKIPDWLLSNDTAGTLSRSAFGDITFATGPSTYHHDCRLVVLDEDLGPASKVLGTLLVEQDPETIIVYGDNDRVYPPELCERALHYTRKYPDDAIAVLGGWISAEDQLYCGRSLAVGVNSVSFVGGAGGVAVKRRFFGLGEATLSAFEVANLSKACFLGDDYYLSHLLSLNGVRRRLVFDSCWDVDHFKASFAHGGLSYAPSSHPGGANVEHYQQCIQDLGVDQDLSGDGEFGAVFMFVFSHAWGLFRGVRNWYLGVGFVAC